MTPATIESNALAAIAQMAKDPATDVAKLATLIDRSFRFKPIAGAREFEF